jgi:hypothetical protein
MCKAKSYVIDLPPEKFFGFTFTAAKYNLYVRDNLSEIWSSKSATQKCRYCGSYVPDDERGNCSACGAVRE